MLLGRVGEKKRSRREVDVWEERGVYVLLHDRVPVYIGKTGRKALGVRLREHRTESTLDSGISSPGTELWGSGTSRAQPKKLS